MQNRISSRNISCLIILLILNSHLISSFGTTGNDFWISIIVAAVSMVPILCVYCRILTLNPGKGLFDIICERFGKISGTIVMILLCWYAIFNSARVNRNFTNFVKTISLLETPDLFIEFGMIVTAFFLAKSSIYALGRWSMGISFLVFASVIGTILTAFGYMDFTNIMPVMTHSVQEILKDGFSFGSIAFGEIIFVLICMGEIKKEDSPAKALFWGLAIGSLALLSIILRNLFVLSDSMVANSVFPSYTAVRIISSSRLLDRFEIIISINLIFLGITKMALLLKAAAIACGKLLQYSDVKKLTMPVSILSYALSSIIFKNNEDIFAFIYPYSIYSVLFFIFIPVVLWILSEINKKRNTNSLKV